MGRLEGGMNGFNSASTFERQALPPRRIEHPREGEQKPSIRRAGLSRLGLSHCGMSYQTELSKSIVLGGTSSTNPDLTLRSGDISHIFYIALLNESGIPF